MNFIPFQWSLLFLSIIFLHQGCRSVSPNSSNLPISHARLDSLLSQYVSEDGRVDYRGLQQDSLRLNQYLDLVSHNPPNNRWSQPERLAYWLNSYNAFTLQLVIRHYPVTSIKDIGKGLTIPFVNTVWDIPFIQIGEKTIDLNNLEHSVLRKEFDDPRIHFAIVCASKSCPYLRAEAYHPSFLDQQLEDQAIRFINDGIRNQVTGSNVYISKIFKWYKGDFTKKTGLIDFLNQYSKVAIPDHAEIKFLEYDWSLNE